MARGRQQQETGRSRPARGGQAGGGSPLERFREMVVWPESIVAGVTAWFSGLALTYVIVWLFDVGGDALDTFDAVSYIYFESLGGAVEPSGLFDATNVTTLAYASLESNWFGIGIALHALVPMLVLLLAGYVLAGRHVKSGSTRRPRDTVIAGMTVALWFTALTVLSVLVASGDNVSIDMVEVLAMPLLYAGVFTAIGATIRSRARLSSGWGILGGVGAFLLVFGLWFVIENPLEDLLADSLSDLEGALEYFEFLSLLVSEHGVVAGELVPELYVAVVPLLVGAALAYTYSKHDPLVGLGEGSKLAVGYFVPVFIIVVGRTLTVVRDLEQTYETWPSAEVDTVNLLIGTVPGAILLGGVVYPVLFAAVGGAIGAAVYRMQHEQEATEGPRAPASQPPPREQPGQPGEHQQGAGRRSGQHRAEQQPAGRQQGHQQAGGPPGEEQPSRRSEEPNEYQQAGGPPGEEQPSRRSEEPNEYQQAGGPPGEEQPPQREPDAGNQPPQDGSHSPGEEPSGTRDAVGGQTDTPEDTVDETEELSASDIVGDEMDEDASGDEVGQESPGDEMDEDASGDEVGQESPGDEMGGEQSGDEVGEDLQSDETGGESSGDESEDT